MRLLNKMPVYVTRRAAPVNVRGKMIPGPETALVFRGNIQPFNDIDTLLKEFGSNVDGAIVIFTQSRLFMKEAGQDADLIDYEGRTYQVRRVQRYSINDPHYEVVAVVEKGQK